VSHGQTVRRGGAYNRLAEPAWADPLDVSHSQRHGGRWNAPGTFGVLYLNRGVRTARLQVHHRLLGQPYGVEDLDAAEQHDLVDVDVPDIEWLDCVTDDGLRAVGLPVGYPRDRDGAEVAWSACRPVAQAAHDDGLRAWRAGQRRPAQRRTTRSSPCSTRTPGRFARAGARRSPTGTGLEPRTLAVPE
jgi:hypothetical protein